MAWRRVSSISRSARKTSSDAVRFVLVGFDFLAERLGFAGRRVEKRALLRPLLGNGCHLRAGLLQLSG